MPQDRVLRHGAFFLNKLRQTGQNSRLTGKLHNTRYKVSRLTPERNTEEEAAAIPQ